MMMALPRYMAPLTPPVRPQYKETVSKGEGEYVTERAVALPTYTSTLRRKMSDKKSAPKLRVHAGGRNKCSDVSSSCDSAGRTWGLGRKSEGRARWCRWFQGVERRQENPGIQCHHW